MVTESVLAFSGFVAFYYYFFGRHLGEDITKTGFFNRLFSFWIKKPNLADFFKVTKSPKINYVIYQFGLRPSLPLMDILYLEYLHSLLKNGAIENIIIFPSIDLSSPQQNLDKFNLFQQNIKKIFKNYEDKITFYDTVTSNSIDNDDLTSYEFLKMIEELGSKEYFRYLKTEWKMNIRNINDFNKYHPANKKLLYLFTHIIGAWQVIKYLVRNNILKSSGASKLELGFILWETEADKLGIFIKCVNKYPNIRLSTLLGKTVMDKHGIPLPAYDEDYAINLFQQLHAQFRKLNNCSKSMIRKNVSILEVILKENYSMSDQKTSLISDGRRIFEQEIKSASTVRIKLKYPKQAYILISLLNRLMCIYNNGQQNS